MASIFQHSAKTNYYSCSSSNELNGNTGSVVMNTMLNNAEETTQPQPQPQSAYSEACLIGILQLNEAGIELFRHQGTLVRYDKGAINTAGNNSDKDHLRRSLKAFQQAASKLAPLIDNSVISFKMTNVVRQVTDVIDTSSLQDETKNSHISHPRVSPSLQSTHQTHDYEQTDLISLGGLTSEQTSWISTASIVVLHNLGLAMLASIRGKNIINYLSPLKLCLELSKHQQTDNNEQIGQALLLSQVQASANYLMGLTLYKKSCPTFIGDQETKEGEQTPSKEEKMTYNSDGSSSNKRRKLTTAESDDSRAATKLQQQQNKMMLLYKSLEYVLDGLGAMNEYQSHLMTMAAAYPDSSKSPVDTTSIPIGLFYILGQVYLRLNMRRDAHQAFQRCTWFVQSRQHQLVADEMLMGGSVKTFAGDDSAVTNKDSADGVPSSMNNNNNKTKKTSPLTRNAAAA